MTLRSALEVKTSPTFGTVTGLGFISAMNWSALAAMRPKVP